MSEIADELERMAGEFETRRQKLIAAAADARRDQQKSKRTEERLACASCAEEYSAQAVELLGVVTKLRTRATELRQQRSESTYKPQPKPAEVKAGQWWLLQWEVGVFRYPVRILLIGEKWIDMETERCGRCSVASADFLTDDRWIYLGDGPEPAT